MWWHRWQEGEYALIEPDANSIWRSLVFPGLWLDGACLWAGDLAGVLATLQAGLATPEHAEFVARLAAHASPVPRA